LRSELLFVGTVFLSLSALGPAAAQTCGCGTFKKTTCYPDVACCCSWVVGGDTETQCIRNATCVEQNDGTCADSATCWQGISVPMPCNGQDGEGNCCCLFTDEGNPTRSCMDQLECQDLSGNCL